MALPSLKDYYIAAQLRPIVCWFNPSYEARWKQIELSLFSEVPVQAVIADDNLLRAHISKEHPWITITLEIWATVIKNVN